MSEETALALGKQYGREVKYWASPACLMKVRRFNEVLENSRF